MKNIDPEKIQTHIEKKECLRAKRKRPSMKVSGASVKKLRKIIINKSKLGA